MAECCIVKRENEQGHDQQMVLILMLLFACLNGCVSACEIMGRG